jgi:hypothetical protein
MELTGQLRVPVALPQAEEAPVPIGREAEWAPDPMWTLRNEIKHLLSFPESNTSNPACSSSLYRLSYSGSTFISRERERERERRENKSESQNKSSKARNEFQRTQEQRPADEAEIKFN